MSRIEYDVVLVGAGPGNLTAAWRLVQLADKPIKIAILDKSKDIGGHLLSGAVSNPRVLRKIFPDWDKGDMPLEGIVKESYLSILGSKGWADAPRMVMPDHFKKEGYAILNISDLAVYMEKKISEAAEEKEGVCVDFYPGFPAREIIYDGSAVVGVKVDDTGDDEKDNLYGKITLFGEKGFISRDLKEKLGLIKNSDGTDIHQIYAVGVKEVWETKQSYEGKVWHTAGFPLEKGHMGGGFIYGCKNNKLIIGLVMALDSPNPNLRPPQLLQEMKKHPRIQKMIKGGKLAKYGAAILPEGGYYSLPDKFAVDGAMMIGDSLGLLDVKRFSGVDKAMESGYIAAETIVEALNKNECSADALKGYQSKLMNSWVGRELFDSRYFRRAFSDYPELLNKAIPAITKGLDKGRSVVASVISMGLCDPLGSLKLLGAKTMMESPSDMGAISYSEDRAHIDPSHVAGKPAEPVGFDSSTVFSTADIVFYSHTHYEEDNDHIKEFDPAVCVTCIKRFGSAGKDTPCVGDCTAEVHETIEKDGEKVHAMALENCVQCTTCEIVCPSENIRVTAALNGYGPDFSGM